MVEPAAKVGLWLHGPWPSCGSAPGLAPSVTSPLGLTRRRATLTSAVMSLDGYIEDERGMAYWETRIEREFDAAAIKQPKQSSRSDVSAGESELAGTSMTDSEPTGSLESAP